MPPKDAGKQIEKAVDEALARGDCDEASRIAAGHPKPAMHLRLMERINGVRDGGQTVDPPHGEDTETAATAPDDAPPALVMFALDHAPATIVSFNARAENHGTTHVPAADVKFRANLAANKLDEFDPDLRRFFFCKRNSREDDLADMTHEAPNMRIPQLKTVAWDGTYPGYRLALFEGVARKTIVDISDCTLDDVKFEPKEGGTVVVEWTLKIHHDAKVGGVLSTMVKSTVDVSLVPPEYPPQRDLVQQAA